MVIIFVWFRRSIDREKRSPFVRRKRIDGRALLPLPEQVEDGGVIGVQVEDRPADVAAAEDVVGVAAGAAASGAGHGRMVAAAERTGKRKLRMFPVPVPISQSFVDFNRHPASVAQLIDA
jgi:hypothetical protein